MKKVNRLNRLGPLIADIAGLELSDVDKDVLRHPKLGGLILFTRNYESVEQLSALVRTIREIRPELLLSVDHEGGRVQRFREGFTRIPAMANLGRMYEENPQLALKMAKDAAWLMASELTALDIDLSYAPILDLDDDKSQIIGDRSFSNDIDIATALAESFIEGMAEAGMKSTAKHFPGHGSVRADSHLELPIDPRDFHAIYNNDLQPFIRLKDQYAAVMTAHIAFTDFDTLPVSFSNKWIQDVLKAQLGFKGVVFSDDLSMKGADTVGAACDKVEKALTAGCDLLLLCNARNEAELALEYLERKQLGEGGRVAELKHTFTQDKKEWASRRTRALHSIDKLLN